LKENMEHEQKHKQEEKIRNDYVEAIVADLEVELPDILIESEAEKMIEEFSRGEINILCATSIAEEGLDIPEVNAVIFYETIPSAIRAIQRAGRTARLKPGKLIMVITKQTRDESNYYVSKSRERKMQSAIAEVKSDLKFPEKQITKEAQKKLFG